MPNDFKLEASARLKVIEGVIILKVSKAEHLLHGGLRRHLEEAVITAIFTAVATRLG